MPIRSHNSFRVLIVGVDRTTDEKFFSQEGDAIRYAEHEGPEKFEDHVREVKVFSPDGELVWQKQNPKELSDPVTAAAIATNRAGLWWQGRKRKREETPEKLFCRKCQQMQAYRTEKRRFSLRKNLLCQECSGRIELVKPWIDEL